MADVMEHTAPQLPAKLPRLDACLCLALCAAGLAINLALVHCANRQNWLTGEEASVAFKDVVFLSLRLQHCRYDTNLGGHLLFALAHAVHPDPGLWYGREMKAVLMALAGPLTYLLARRLGLSRTASAFSGFCLLVFPGFSSFSWLGMEAGLEVLFGGLALYLVIGRNARIRTWPLAAALLAFGVLVYGGGAAFVPPVFGVMGWRAWRERSTRSLLVAISAGAIFAAVLSLPGLWWVNTANAYRGGGTLELGRSPILFLRLMYESFYRPHSYYFFSTSPSLGGFVLIPLLAVAAYASTRRANAWWPFWCLALGSAALYSIATPTGVRRAIPLVLVASLLMGSLLDHAVQSRRFRSTSIAFVSALVLLWLGGETLATGLALRHGRLALPHDFDWISADMRPLLEPAAWIADGRERILRLERPIRAMCLNAMLPARNHPGSESHFTRNEIRAHYLAADPERFQ